MYIPKYFKAYELVPKEEYLFYGENAFCLIDERILKFLDMIRDDYNLPVHVNNWKNGGQFDERGYRNPSTKTGALKSPHKPQTDGKCHAVDFHILDKKGKLIPAKDIRTHILNNHDRYFQYITRLEDDVTWVHADNRPTGKDRIYLFKP